MMPVPQVEHDFACHIAAVDIKHRLRAPASESQRTPRSLRVVEMKSEMPDACTVRII
jgi:hypothetical protein